MILSDDCFIFIVLLDSCVPPRVTPCEMDGHINMNIYMSFLQTLQVLNGLFCCCTLLYYEERLLPTVLSSSFHFPKQSNMKLGLVHLLLLIRTSRIKWLHWHETIIQIMHYYAYSFALIPVIVHFTTAMLVYLFACLFSLKSKSNWKSFFIFY